MNFLKEHKKPAAAVAVALAIAAVAVIAPRSVYALNVTDTIANWLSGLAYMLIQFLANLLVVIINIMVAIAQYNDFLNAPAVTKGWVIVRDISNMFFIVVLLIIAFGTILRLENYRYNRLLARLIVMAVLVNFSKFIAGFFIDFAQVVMLTFVNAWRDAAAGNITAGLGLDKIVSISQQNSTLGFTTSGNNANEGAILSAMVLGLFLILTAVVVMAIVAIVLILRILVLWFLIVLSPLAYLFRTYPSTEKYASRWWSEFGKYVITGPVIAFLLWLSLSIMSDSGQLVDKVFTENLNARAQAEQGQVVNIGSSSGTAATISATITEIGKSSNLLQYIMGIMLLIGTLIMTKELGVAGGQLAGQAAERLRSAAQRAAILGGTAATFGAGAAVGLAARKPLVGVAKIAGKGLGNRIIDTAQARLGVPLRPSAWVEGFKKASTRRRHDMEDKMIQKGLSRLTGYKRDVAERKYKIFGRQFGPKTGRTITEQVPPNVLLGGAVSPEYFRYNVVPQLGKFATGRGGELTGAEFHAQQLELESLRNDLKQRRLAFEVRSGLKTPEQVYVDDEVSQEKNREEARRQAAVEAKATQIATERLTPAGSKYNFEDRVDPDTGTATKVFIDEAMREQNIDPRSDPARDALKRDFLEKWDRDRARDELAFPDMSTVLDQKRNDIVTSKSSQELRQLGIGVLNRQAAEFDAKARDIKAGQLSDGQVEKKKDELKRVEDQLKKIDDDIRKKKEVGVSPDAGVLTMKDKLDQQRRQLEQAIKNKTPITKSDKDASEKDADKLIEQAKVYREHAQKVLTPSDLKLVQDQMMEKQREVQAQEKVVSQLRPAIPAELRRELRASINEKKKDLTSDSWQEHLSVLEDAMRKHDVPLAAAALYRATEYGNENEILNSFGYSSDAIGLKEFIQEEFVKGLHMAEDQALAIATDLSYIAEKGRHWGVARLTTVDSATGRQKWQAEEDRNREVLAEIRKLDFEDFGRRTNRLGWGKEVVGLTELGPDATREERAAHFRAGGGRDFVMAPYAQAFLSENFAKMIRNMSTGRFNVNLAVKLLGDANSNQMKQILGKLGDVTFEGEKGKFSSFADFMGQLSNYGARKQETGEFDLVNHFLQGMAKNR